MGNDDEFHSLTVADQKKHLEFSKELLPDQVKALSEVYPDFRLLEVCAGQFSGVNQNELVLGVWKPVDSKDWWKREVHRLGLIWDKSMWAVHAIDDEIQQDKKLSHSFPMAWQYSFSDKGFVGEMKCGVDLGKDPDLHPNLSNASGNKPFFDLPKTELSKNKTICFATSDTYNNWDCVVYSPKDGRFRLWYQQVNSD